MSLTTLATTLRRLARNLVGVAVHGSALFFMIHGLVTNAWYGYLFVALYGAMFLALFVLTRRARRRAERLFRRIAARDGGDRDDAPGK